jgi:hypothetical protein
VLKLAALALVAASTTSTPAPLPNASWWERVTMTVSGDGEGKSCRFESSLEPGTVKRCDVTAASMKASAEGSGVYTRITFERRFSPGDRPDIGELQPGDTLLGSQVMALGIDDSGAVDSCRILVSAGDLLPDYGCQEVRAERFSASTGQTSERAHHGYMTIIVYGHSAHVA